MELKNIPRVLNNFAEILICKNQMKNEKILHYVAKIKPSECVFTKSVFLDEVYVQQRKSTYTQPSIFTWI